MRLAGLCLLIASGCARDPIEAECPNLAEGQLVITEVRGPQMDDADTLGSWVELFNDGGAPIDLQGITLRFRQLDGTGPIEVRVRRSVMIAPGGYAVLGRVDDTMRPAHVDYGFLADFSVGFYTSAAIDVLACDERIDLVQYSALPRMGTYSLDGMPSAEENDKPASWCFDGTMAGATYPGTPKQPNIACP